MATAVGPGREVPALIVTKNLEVERGVKGRRERLISDVNRTKKEPLI